MSHAEGQAVFLAPRGLDMSFYRTNFPEVEEIAAPAHHFASRGAYSHWLTSRSFYDIFSGLEYILICQTDAILLRPVSIDHNAMVDYVGAPWKDPFTLTWNPLVGTLRHGSNWGVRKKVSVGNGGFSLRKVSSFARASVLLPRLKNQINEDLIWSYFGGSLGLKIATKEEARKFAAETESSNDQISDIYGVHALFEYNRNLENQILIKYGFTDLAN